jgi:hypothetical protein
MDSLANGNPSGRKPVSLYTIGLVTLVAAGVAFLIVKLRMFMSMRVWPGRPDYSVVPMDCACKARKVKYWLKVVSSTNPSLYQRKIIRENRPLEPLVTINKQEYVPSSNGVHLVACRDGKIAFSRHFNTWCGTNSSVEALYEALADITDPVNLGEFDLVILMTRNGLGDIRRVAGRMMQMGKFNNMPKIPLQDEGFVPYIWIFNGRTGKVIKEVTGETSLVVEDVIMM